MFISVSTCEARAVCSSCTSFSADLAPDCSNKNVRHAKTLAMVTANDTSMRAGLTDEASANSTTAERATGNYKDGAVVNVGAKVSMAQCYHPCMCVSLVQANWDATQLSKGKLCHETQHRSRPEQHRASCIVT